MSTPGGGPVGRRPRLSIEAKGHAVMSLLCGILLLKQALAPNETGTEMLPLVLIAYLFATVAYARPGRGGPGRRAIGIGAAHIGLLTLAVGDPRPAVWVHGPILLACGVYLSVTRVADRGSSGRGPSPSRPRLPVGVLRAAAARLRRGGGSRSSRQGRSSRSPAPSPPATTARSTPSGSAGPS